MYTNLLSFSVFVLLFCSIEYSWAKKELLVLASNEPISTHNIYYCAVVHVFSNMGYDIKIVKIPLIRGELEAQKGNYPLVDTFKLSLSTKSKYSGSSEGIEVTETPYLIEPINVYTLQKSNILISDTNPLSSYSIGVIRNQYSYDKENKNKDNFTYYSTTLAAFMGLSLSRVDLVISPPKAYQAIESKIKNPNDISILFSHGSTYRHIGFSHKYFGIKRVKDLAQKYELEMTKYLQNPSLTCDDNSAI